MASNYLQQETLGEAERRARRTQIEQLRDWLTCSARNEAGAMIDPGPAVSAIYLDWVLAQPECGAVSEPAPERSPLTQRILARALSQLADLNGTLEHRAVLAENAPGPDAIRQSGVFKDWRHAVRWARLMLDPTTQGPAQTLESLHGI